MLYFIFKSTNPATIIVVSNLKYDIDISTLTNFGNNVKDLHNDMSSNYSIIVDKGERCEDYVRHIFRALLSYPNSNFNHSIEINKDDWDTGIEVLS